ncbi:HD-GYP domain-containing protein [Sporosarcina oncorhynchi]|uniref:HD-GYP domain-containing protein n=1 Tax=Sporosarcina oncorhynchi TaxID=3056444 RepID=A0ABZ0L712_9BACL|nr:HD-GYP domain-containing protein [Sporosarcina sp. T2O-4]WOV87169.1 HD-GYP domain-containing protein [Sporosarcina sp. T2O-4]
MGPTILHNTSTIIEGNHPILQLTSGTITLLGRKGGLAEAHFNLNKEGSFCAQYNISHSKSELYTILDGKVEIEYDNQRWALKVGETIDASIYNKLITFYAITDAKVLLNMDACFYERNFFEMQSLQEEMEAVARVDGYTYHHCDRIRKYAIEVWKKFNQPSENLKLLRWGAYLHDIGKLAIPLEILNKPGKLTPEEWTIMKTHSIKGADILRAHKIEWLEDVAFIIEQHHERYDGKGYPFGLKGDEISIEAAIVSVVDAYDAMTTERVYKEAMSPEEAIYELKKGKGTQFHPAAVDNFIKCLQENKFD